MLTHILANLRTQSFRRVYLAWGLILIIGFLLSGYGVGNGYFYWFPLILIGLCVQAQAGLTGWQAKFLLLMWAGLTWLGTYYTLLVFTGALRPDDLFPHIGMAWLLTLGLGQIVTGYLAKQKIEWIVGLVWVIIAIILRDTSMDILASFILIAALTGLPYIYFAVKK